LPRSHEKVALRHIHVKIRKRADRPHLCEVYPGICLTTEEKARKNLSQGSRRVLIGTMKIHKLTIRI
jgi:hypothetical protein